MMGMRGGGEQLGLVRKCVNVHLGGRRCDGVVMVDQVPEIDEIDSREKLEVYLSAQPLDVAQVVSLRCAVRVMPLLASALMSHRFNYKLTTDLTKNIFRALFLSWSKICYPDYDFNFFYTGDHSIYPDFDDQKTDVDSTGYSVLFAASCANFTIFTTFSENGPVNSASYAVSAANDALSISGVPHELTWQIVIDDLLTSQNHEPRHVLGGAIWKIGATPNSIVKSKLEFENQLLKFGEEWSVVWDFYITLERGGFPFSHLGDRHAEVVVAIANEPEEFWDKDSNDVMKEVATRLQLPNVLPQSPPDAKPAPNIIDFFISYSTNNEIYAREINDYLEEVGYSTIAQFKDFAVGSNFVTEMQKGLAAADRVIALLSPAYVTSKQCQAEWNTAYNSDPLSERRHLIPLLVEKADLLPLAKQIVYKTLVGLEGEARRTAVLEAIGKVRRAEVSGVTSPYDFELTAADTISAVGGGMNATSVLPNRDPKDAQNRLEAARDIAGDLMAGLRSNSYQVRHQYLTELENYLRRLPLARGESIYSADAALRNLRDDLEGDLNQGIDERFAKRCLRLIEAHYGLRVYFPELLDFYDDVRNARQTEPLPLEALSKLRATVEQLTPEVFEPSVGEAFGHAVDVAHPLHDHASGHDTSYEGGESAGAPVSLPPDPIADIDPMRAAQHAEISMQNRIWGLLRRVEDGGKAVERIDKAVTAYSKFIDPILDWLSKSN